MMIKKLASVLLSAMLCMSVMVSAPCSQCSASDQPEGPVPYVGEGGGDCF